MESKETDRYIVTFRREHGGELRRTTCATLAGYTTRDDIPQMIRTKYGHDAVIESITPIAPEED